MHVVFLHGPPAAGKRTVGIQLAERLQWPLFHNHLVVDAALSLFPFGSEPFVRLRAALWRAAFQEAARAEQNFVFTFNPERTVAPALIDEMLASVTNGGGIVYFVALTCEPAVVLERLASPDRARFGKLTDRDLYRRLVADGAFDFPPLPAPLLTVDTGRVTAEQAADDIAASLLKWLR